MYAVVRIQNVDSRGPGGVLRHCLRAGPLQDHVDPDGEFKVLVGPPFLGAATAAAKSAVPERSPDGRRVRKDAVQHVQVLLRVPPEALRYYPSGEVEAREAFEAAAKVWLKQHCPGKVVHAVAHYDEAAPHVHALVVPVVPAPDGSLGLSRKQAFGGRTKQEARRKLSDLQTTWAEACQAEDLEVERGKARVDDPWAKPPEYVQSIHQFKRRAAEQEIGPVLEGGPKNEAHSRRLTSPAAPPHPQASPDPGRTATAEDFLRGVPGALKAAVAGLRTELGPCPDQPLQDARREATADRQALRQALGWVRGLASTLSGLHDRAAEIAPVPEISPQVDIRPKPAPRPENEAEKRRLSPSSRAGGGVACPSGPQSGLEQEATQEAEIQGVEPEPEPDEPDDGPSPGW